MTWGSSLAPTRPHILDRLGFDRDRLAFTGRTAVVAFLAVALAWAFGLGHPQWAGMSVWAASQPLRGHLLEKSLNRFLGTVVGAVFGILLLVASDGSTWILVLGLSLWIGLCAGLGNLVRGFLSYGVMLSGYSAAMVTLLHDPQSTSLVDTGLDRMATVLVGVVLALVLGWLLSEKTDPDAVRRRGRRLAGEVLSDFADALTSGQGEETRRAHGLLAEMGAMEETLDAQTAGSPSGRGKARWIRRLLSALVALLPWMRRPPVGADVRAIAQALREAAEALAEGQWDGQEGRLDRALSRAIEATTGRPALASVLTTLRDVLGEAIPVQEGTASEASSLPATRTHRDWVGAREAGLRALAATFAAGAIWQVTGWSVGGFLTLGVAIMITVFSAMDNPVGFIRFVVVGQILGVLGALACRWLVWPHLGGEGAAILSMAPFMMAGALLFAHRRFGTLGFDYNMVFLLLLHPAWPLTGQFVGGATAGLAVVLGPVVALVGYRTLFPVTAHRRFRSLLVMLVGEVEAMAARADVGRHAAHWWARLHHRVLRLARWAEKTGMEREEAMEVGFTILLLGRVILHLDGLPEAEGGEEREAGSRRALFLARERLRRVGRDPLAAARALAHLSERKGNVPSLDRRLLAEAARDLTAVAPTFQKAFVVR
ncbi:FUSC family protein [Rhodospirillum sp. A1_3_36]|uniref:FUSC family protein n=1 Tax=Rhodospirillum sp. A1_3_36 TaxID=3391666 RepID=UPI0039A5E067